MLLRKLNAMIENKLFKNGAEAFNQKKFYEAHEIWEDLWSNYKIDDAKCIQGLIQLSVSYFHFYNGNIKGARSMMAKCLTKFDGFNNCRGLNIIELIEDIKKVNEYFNKIDTTLNISNNYIIKLKIMDR